MKVHVRVEDAGAAASLKAARRDIQREVAKALPEAVEDVVLPAARRAAPRQSGKLAAAIAVKASGVRGAFLELSKRKVKYAGLIVYGGERRDVIRPRSAQALSTPAGPRAAVTTPRRYSPNPFLEHVVERNRARVRAELQRTIAAALGRRGVPID